MEKVKSISLNKLFLSNNLRHNFEISCKTIFRTFFRWSWFLLVCVSKFWKEGKYYINNYNEAFLLLKLEMSAVRIQNYECFRELIKLTEHQAASSGAQTLFFHMSVKKRKKKNQTVCRFLFKITFLFQLKSVWGLSLWIRAQPLPLTFLCLLQMT